MRIWGSKDNRTLGQAAKAQGQRRMPFGPYKGLPLDQLPADYIRDVLGWIENTGSGLVEALQEELEGRTSS